jgi:hypothetical protein
MKFRALLPAILVGLFAIVGQAPGQQRVVLESEATVIAACGSPVTLRVGHPTSRRLGSPVPLEGFAQGAEQRELTHGLQRTCITLAS